MPELVDQRFNIPVLEFIVQILRERFPDLEVRPGSAVYNLLVFPAAALLQPFYDRLTTLSQNQSILRFEDQFEHEVDLLLANFFVTRKQGSTAAGTVRVFFPRPLDAVIDTSARFTTADGVAFAPATRVSITSASMTLRVQDGLNFVDVPVTAVEDGGDGVVEANTITQFTGITGAVKVSNPAATFAGRDIETNSDFIVRARETLATRTVTSDKATRSVLFDEFDALKSIEVIGFGDEDMERDVVSVVSTTAPIFEGRFARKMNVPFNGAGEPVLVPSVTDQLKGVVIDTLDATSDRDPYFFHKLELVTDEIELQKVSIQIGDPVRILDTTDPDFGEIFKVVDILFAQFDGVEQAVHGLVLDKTFKQPSVWTSGAPSADQVTATQYSVDTAIRVDKFHIGGKVDVIINSSNIVAETVLVTLLANSIDTTFSDVPITTDVVLDILGQPLFEENRSFLLPFLTVQQIDVVDPSDDGIVLSTLREGTDFVFLTRDPDLRFTENEESLIRIKGFNGSRVKITYLTNADVAGVQAFLSQTDIRDLTKDVLVKSVEPRNTDILLQYEGDQDVVEVKRILTNYISDLPQAGTITVSDIDGLLKVFGVRQVRMPVTITVSSFGSGGQLEVDQSQDRITISKREIFAAVPDLSVTKVG